MLTLDKLRAIAPAAGLFPSLIEACEAYGVDTPLRQAHFLAQCAHESGGFKATVENLNYSAAALRSLFGKYFRDDPDACAYARQAERIANRMYANRMGNGPESSGDGWRMRGHGLIQLTGTDNIRAFSIRYYGDDRLVANPAPLAKDPLAAYAAADFWRERRLNRQADADDILGVTKIVNGGTHGLDDRQQWLARAKAVLL